jgi:hypothetical protein
VEIHHSHRRSRTDVTLVTWAWASVFLTPVVWFVVFLLGELVTMDGTRLHTRPWIWFLEASASLVVVAPLILTMTLSVLAWMAGHRALTLVPAAITVAIPARELMLTTHDVWPLLLYGLGLQVAVVLVLRLVWRRAAQRRTASEPQHVGTAHLSR